VSEQIRTIPHVYGFHSEEIEGFNSLLELAMDMHWTWNHATDDLWRQLDAVLWEQTHNPCDVLQTVSRDKLKNLLSNTDFRAQIDNLLQAKKLVVESPAWFQESHPQSPLSCVAYFSMEYMLSDALPIYSGGLGNVAGDQLKSASDLGVPVVGVGLLYQQGYFRQVIDKNGAQQAFYPYNDPGQLPITPLRKTNGEWLRLEIVLPGYTIWLRTWQVLVGRVKLYLLDSNDSANFPAHRGITSELYGGGSELRLMQEMVLGLGGWSLLRALELNPEVCHLNEGHTALVVLGRALSFMEETGQPFDVALAVTSSGNLFTTHTAVTAGFDRFAPALIEQYLGRYANKLGISLYDLLALGRQNPNDPSEPFNMAYLAVRGSCAVNGVSRLHGQVSRNLFASLFPHWPVDEVPITHITNGVHMPTWDSAEADELWTEACGKDRWLGKTETLEREIRSVSDTRLWQFRIKARQTFVTGIRERLSKQLSASGASTEAIEEAKHIFAPDVLTLGFARRFATYKRPNMLLHDPERLMRLLTNLLRPVQLIMAGKAHPADQAGQDMIHQWIQFTRRPEVRLHVMFISDYNILLSESLVQGADVWINTPRRPWEACGTSGMKVLVNGGINLSELDGWWAEAFTPEVGWALGDVQEHGDDLAWDAREAETLYELLENEVIPEYYARDKQGIPVKWVQRVRDSMAQLTPYFSANRTVREYTEQHYIPAASAYLKRANNKGAIGVNIVDWRDAINQKWVSLRFGEMKIVTDAGQHVFEVQVYLDDLNTESVRVELYANGIESGSPEKVTMKLVRQLVGAIHGYIYRIEIPASRPSSDYTARLIPYFNEVSVPLENNRVLWQK
jgi:starch phosphorylase